MQLIVAAYGQQGKQSDNTRLFFFFVHVSLAHV